MTDAASNLLEIEDRVGIAGRLAEAAFMATSALDDASGNALRQVIGELQHSLQLAEEAVQASYQALVGGPEEVTA